MSDYEDADEALDYEFDGASGGEEDFDGPGDALAGEEDDDDEAAEVDLGSQDTDEADDDDDDDDGEQNDGEVRIHNFEGSQKCLLTDTCLLSCLQGGDDDDDDDDDAGEAEGDEVRSTSLCTAVLKLALLTIFVVSFVG